MRCRHLTATQNGEINMSEGLQDVRTAFLSAASSSIEDMTFQPIDEVKDLDEKPDHGEKSFVWSILPIFSPHEGEMLVEIPEDYARNLTQEMFGFEKPEEVSEEMLIDSVAEIVNTIAGKFMTELVPPDQVYTLGLPKAGLGESPELDDVAVRIQCSSGGENLILTVAGFDYINYKNEN